MNRYTKVRELVKDPSLTIKDIAQQTGYDKGHVSRLRKASQQFECPRCGHCCQPQNDTPLRYRSVADGWVDADDTSEKRVDETVKTEHEWVGLTEEEVSDVIDNVLEGGGWLDVARAIEQALKEKNT